MPAIQKFQVLPGSALRFSHSTFPVSLDCVILKFEERMSLSLFASLIVIIIECDSGWLSEDAIAHE